MDNLKALGASPIGIVGLGAMGASIGLALRAAGEQTIGFDPSTAHLETSAQLGAIFLGTPRPEDLSCCRTIFVAVPPADVVTVAKKFLSLTNATVVDIASVKKEIADALWEPRFVPTHPLRGTHLTGPGAAKKDLFVGATWAVCPNQATSQKSVLLTERLIRRMGARPLRLDATTHDALVAKTSHLPHVVASALVQVLGGAGQVGIRRMVGEGFLDTTRIARANPALWTDIALHNQAAIGRSIEELVEILQRAKSDIVQGNMQGVHSFFGRGRQLMEDLCPLAVPQTHSTPLGAERTCPESAAYLPAIADGSAA